MMGGFVIVLFYAFDLQVVPQKRWRALSRQRLAAGPVPEFAGPWGV